MARRPNPPVPGSAPRVLTQSDIEKNKSHAVKAMISTGTPLKAIAEMLKIGVVELKRKYPTELKHGKDYVYAKVSLGLVNDAFNGDIRSMMAWMRHCGGWQDVSRREITGKDGAPISFRNLDSGALTEVVAALRSQAAATRSRSRGGTQIEGGSGDILDLAAISGSSDEGAEE